MPNAPSRRPWSTWARISVISADVARRSPVPTTFIRTVPCGTR